MLSSYAGERLLRYSAHYGPVNSLAVNNASGRELLLTGGDDGVARVWDPSIEGLKEAVAEFDDGLNGVVTAVEWSRDGNQCFVGGVDNEIKVRSGGPEKGGSSLTLRRAGLGPENQGGALQTQGAYGHGEQAVARVLSLVLTSRPLQIASLSLSPNGHFLASYGFDSTLIIHDVRPWTADPTRVHRTLTVRMAAS